MDYYRINWGGNFHSDLLPKFWFDVKKPGSSVGTHRIDGDQKEFEAKCDIVFDGEYYDLNYESYEAPNKKNGYLIGVTRIQFSATLPKGIVYVAWKDKGKNNSRYYSISAQLMKICLTPPRKAGENSFGI